MPAHLEPAMEPLGIMQSPLMLSGRDWGPHKTQQQSVLMRKQHLTSCRGPGGHVAGQQVGSGFEAFPSLQALNPQTPRDWWGSLTAVSHSCWCWAFVCVCVCETSWDHGWEANMALAPLLRRKLGSPCASSRWFPWVKPSYPSQVWSCAPPAQFLQLWVSHHCWGWNLQPCYRQAFPSVKTLSMSKEMLKSQNIKSYMFSVTRQGFFQSGVCLRVTKVHAEAWLRLLPTVPSLHSTANCNV